MSQGPPDDHAASATAICAARPEDYSAIGALHAQSWQSAYASVFPRDRLHGDIQTALIERWTKFRPLESDLVLVAKQTGESSDILGFCAIWCRPDPYLDNLHVAPDVSRRGIGEALLRQAASLLVSRAHLTLTLTVFRSNPTARAFYARFGGHERAIPDPIVFGQRVPSVEVFWSDITVLATNE